MLSTIWWGPEHRKGSRFSVIPSNPGAWDPLGLDRAVEVGRAGLGGASREEEGASREEEGASFHLTNMTLSEMWSPP